MTAPQDPERPAAPAGAQPPPAEPANHEPPASSIAPTSAARPAVKPPGSRLVAVLLASAALVAAIITARASFASNEASGLWQQALRLEVKSAAAVVEDIRYVYTVEGRQAFRYATAKVREDEFRKAAGTLFGTVRDAVLIEAEVQKRLADSILNATEIAGDPRYALPGGGYDLILRLADARAKAPDLVALDPDGTDLQGETPAGMARSLMVATIPVGAAFMFGALAQAFPARRRLLLVVGAGALVGGASLALLVELLW